MSERDMLKRLLIALRVYKERYPDRYENVAEFVDWLWKEYGYTRQGDE